MNNDLMFSSKNQAWETPADLVANLATVFDWQLDVCASRANVCPTYYDGSVGGDGLVAPWRSLNWCNPPYGRYYPSWLKRGYKEFSMHGHTTVFLVPARPDTRAFQDIAPYASSVTFVAGRLKFGSREAWIAKYNEVLLKAQETKKLVDNVKKIGGALCCDRVQVKMAGMWALMERPYSYAEWCKMDHLKPDPAPFPSAFIVFGNLNGEQHAKLSSYGWTI